MGLPEAFGFFGTPLLKLDVLLVEKQVVHIKLQVLMENSGFFLPIMEGLSVELGRSCGLR